MRDRRSPFLLPPGRVQHALQWICACHRLSSSLPYGGIPFTGGTGCAYTPPHEMTGCAPGDINTARNTYARVRARQAATMLHARAKRIPGCPLLPYILHLQPGRYRTRTPTSCGKFSAVPIFHCTFPLRAAARFPRITFFLPARWAAGVRRRRARNAACHLTPTNPLSYRLNELLADITHCGWRAGRALILALPHTPLRGKLFLAGTEHENLYRVDRPSFCFSPSHTLHCHTHLHATPPATLPAFSCLPSPTCGFRPDILPGQTQVILSQSPSVLGLFSSSPHCLVDTEHTRRTTFFEPAKIPAHPLTILPSLSATAPAAARVRHSRDVASLRPPALPTRPATGTARMERQLPTRPPYRRTTFYLPTHSDT